MGVPLVFIASRFSNIAFMLVYFQIKKQELKVNLFFLIYKFIKVRPSPRWPTGAHKKLHLRLYSCVSLLLCYAHVRPHRLRVRTLPSHGKNRGSNPLGAAIRSFLEFLPLATVIQRPQPLDISRHDHKKAVRKPPGIAQNG